MREKAFAAVLLFAASALGQRTPAAPASKSAAPPTSADVLAASKASCLRQ